LAAACFGLLTGAVEVAAHLVRKAVLNRILAFGNDFVWMTPLADLVIFLLAGLLFLLFSLLLPRLRTPRLVLGVFGTLAAFAPLLLAEQIHKAAVLVLAAGVGVGLARAIAPRQEGFCRFARVTVPALLVLALLAAAGLTVTRRISERQALANGPATRPDAPNILLLVLDTVRAWDIGWMGYWRPTTPRLEGWVSRGVSFDRVLATSPWTTPSHASMFTGHLPVDMSANWASPLDAALPTVAEVLQKAGYATGGFVGNYRYTGRATGLDRGFGHYVDYPVSIEQAFRSAQLTARLLTIPGIAEWMGQRRLIQAGNSAYTVNRDFLDWVGRRGERPFFGFINYFEGHAPYLPPAPWDSMFAKAGDHDRTARYWDGIEQAFGEGPFPRDFLEETHDAYDGSIAYLDFQIDSLLTVMGTRGLLDNTVVIITSDHGEHFGEHGLVQHGSSLFLPVLHVPLAILAPGKVPPGLHVPFPASLRSIASTVLAYAGVPNPGLPGESLTGYLRGPGLPVPVDTLFSAVDYNRLLPKWPPNQPVLRGNMRSVVLDSLHYILNGDGVEELFQLGRDPWQIRNLAGVPEFKPALDAYRAALQTQAQGK
jgi:arylsulfatase A-like enzyme